MISDRKAMKKLSLVLGSCIALTLGASTASLQAQTSPAPDSTGGGGGGIPKAFTQIDDRALPFLSRWTVCEAQVQKLIQQYFKTIGKEPGIDLAKISILGEPKKNGKYELYRIQCGSAIAVKKEIDDNMLQGMKDLIAAPVGAEGEESYCHDFTSVSAVGGKVSTEIDKKVGVGENNFRMPTGGRQYISLSLFEQYLRVGATNWWIQNIIGNDPAGYMFWHAGEAKILARRPLIDNYDNNTRRVVPNLLKFHAGMVYRLTDDAGNPNPRFLDGLLRRRTLSMGAEPKLAAGLEGNLTLGDDNKTAVIGAAVNIEWPISAINEFVPIGDANTYARVPLPNRGRLAFVNSDPNFQFLPSGTRSDGANADALISPLLRRNGQFTFFYTWWLDTEGENPPDNIFRVDLGVNVTEVQDVALVQRRSDGFVFMNTSNIRSATAGGPSLQTYLPQSILDWVYARFEYRNETTFPFGFYAQYSNQILMTGTYLPIAGNWLYLEAKVGVPLREVPRPYEPSVYFMLSPVFRIQIPR
jgi:hypothetical protein